MPSAAVAKPVVDAAAPASLSNDGTVPVRQIMTAAQHRIRNLEKRKLKLEAYQDLRKSGKELTADQEVAISKYEEVVQCLLCTQELLKQIQLISVEWDKETKKLARKETAARVATEVFKVRETLILQELLRQLRNDPAVRSDFATGSNGAVKLDSEDLEIVDKLTLEGFLCLEGAATEDEFTANAHRAADHWVSAVDGKPKLFSLGVTYERVRRVLRSIQDCGYFCRRFKSSDKPPTEPHLASGRAPSETIEPAAEDSSEAEELPPSVANPIPVLQAAEGDSNGVAFPFPAAAEELPAIPEPVAAQDPNSLPEELQSGAFSFLQDCELEAGPTQHPQPGLPVMLPNGFPSPAHHGQLSQPQVAALPQPPVPAANMLLINPTPLMNLGALPAAAPSVGGPAPSEHVHVNGGVTPPMFPFPFQSTGVAPCPSLGQPVANGAVAGLNPVQQLVKTLQANHLQMLQAQSQLLPAVDPQTSGLNGGVAVVGAPPLMMPLNGNGNGTQQSHAPRPMQNGHLGSIGFASQDAQNGEEKSAAHVEHKKHHQQRRRGSPMGVVADSEPMTISEWDPAVGTKEATSSSSNKHKSNHHQKRETSTESSTGGDGKRVHEDRERRHRHSSGFNGSRRRYMDRGSNGGGGGVASNGSNFQGNSHFRMSTGTTNGGGGGGSSGSGGGTFYRNNDPNYYAQSQNGGTKPVRHSQHHQGFNGQQSQRAGNN